MTNWQKLIIYVDESDLWDCQLLYVALIETARKRGIAGATATRAIAGFGHSRTIRTTRILALSANLPVVVTVIDCEEAIAQFLPIVRQMVKSGLITLQTIDVVPSFCDRRR